MIDEMSAISARMLLDKDDMRPCGTLDEVGGLSYYYDLPASSLFPYELDPYLPTVMDHYACSFLGDCIHLL